ncbi:Intradiol ring-cleavage dioxygenase [Lophiotrema nucula]|uniref:Intradiol ring-cleavage dioxygenase n=1 Tax=Lophiotrema nucula TaxID=690887 RepID=A0A6A5YTL8_9PLEO|nr:Intradiol ring-cleavage dioxygenase [Lophiotrema nucula]
MVAANLLYAAIVALFVFGVLGHPRLSDEEFAEYKKLQLRDTEALSHCLQSPALQDIHSRMALEHNATLHRLRAARGVQIDDSPLVRRDRPDLLNWESQNHEHKEQSSQDPQKLWNFKWSDQPHKYGPESGCTLTPESIAGPYWLEGQPKRQNIKGGQSGIPLRLALQVIDISTCLPVHGARVDIWHANAKGEYMSTSARGFLRGWQPTSVHGTVDYDTIFPGHYAGRATHIHTAVKPYDQSHIAHFGMLYFDQSLISTVEAADPYIQNQEPIVLNKNDDFAPSSSAVNYDPFVKYKLVGSHLEDGILAWIPIGVNLNNNHPPRRKRSLMDDHLDH